MASMKIWIRLGISGVIGALFYAVASAFLPGWGFYGAHQVQICIVSMTVGIILWPVGLRMNASLASQKSASAEPPADSSAEEEAGSVQPFLLMDLSFWGLMVFVFSIIMMFIAPSVRPLQALGVTARTNPTNSPAPSITSTNKVALIVPAPEALPVRAATPAPAVANGAPPINMPVLANKPGVVFPALKLQGLICRSPNPSAMINGRTYFVGDYLGEAKVVSIEEQRVVLELGGESKTLMLSK